MKLVSLPRHCYLGVLAALLLSPAMASSQPLTKTASVPLGGTVTASALAKTAGGGWHYFAGLGNGDVVLVPIESGRPGALARTATGLPGIGALAIGDLNNDGLADVVAVNYDPGNIAVLFQGSSGVLGGATKYPIAGGATGAAIVDWNGDGLNDVVVSLYMLNKIAVFSNQGGGNLGMPPDLLACGLGPNAIAAVDLYANGSPGVATANYADDTITLVTCPSVTCGSLVTRSSLLSGQGPADLAKVDLNGDGGDDIVCMNQTSGTVSTFISTPGSPDFASGKSSPVGSVPKNFATLDLNGDGKNDVIVTNHSGEGGFGVFTGDGFGVFAQGPRQFSELGTGGLLEAGDLDGDGKPDVLLIVQQTLHILRNETAGSCFPPLEPPGFTAGGPQLYSGMDVGMRDPGFILPHLDPASSIQYEVSFGHGVQVTGSTVNGVIAFGTPVSDKDYDLLFRGRYVNGCGSASAWRLRMLKMLARPAAFVLLKFFLKMTVSTVPPGTELGSIRVKNAGGVSGDLTLEKNSDALDIDPGPIGLGPGEEREVPIKSTDKTLPGVHHLIVTGNTYQGTTFVTNGILTVSDSPALGNCRFSGETAQRNQDIVVLITPKILRGETGSRAGSGPVAIPDYAVAGLLSPAPWLSALSEKPDWQFGPARRTANLNMKTVPSRYGRFNAPLQATFICDPVAHAECSGKVTLLPGLPVEGNGGNKRATAPSVSAAVPPGGTSIIVPSAVSASGLGGRTLFVSDGWLRNYSYTDLPITLVYTPDSANGLTDPGVLKTQRTLAPSSTLRLVDLVSGFFGTSGSGLVQIRSKEPELLGLRTVVEAVTDGSPKTRYGTEIPTAAYRAGVGLGEGELVLPGIDDDTANRANLILSETSGAEAVVQITLNGPDGSSLGSITKSVPPYSKIQVNGIVNAVAPGRSLSGGWAGVSVTSGSGRVFPVATVIDNASSSFAAIRGRLPRANVAGVPVPASLIIPGVARLPGAFNSTFTTSLSVANGTSSPASLSMTYHYVDADDGNSRKDVTKPLSIAARGALPKETGDDILASLFGITNRSYGWIEMTGDVGQVVSLSAVSSLVDPADRSRGKKTAAVEGVLADSPVIIDKTGQEWRFAGAEKTLFVRTNLILLETSGKPVTVAVRAVTSDGKTLATRSFDVDARQYFQINDVFGPNGLNLGDGPFENVEIAARVTGGDGKLVSFVTRNDNLSANPEIFLLTEPGPPQPSLSVR